MKINFPCTMLSREQHAHVAVGARADCEARAGCGTRAAYCVRAGCRAGLVVGQG